MSEATPQRPAGRDELARRAAPWSTEILAAVIVAGVWLHAFARSINAHLLMEETPALVLGVWIIYGLDHAFDLFMSGRRRLTASSLILSWLVMGALLVWAGAMHLPQQVFFAGISAGLLVVCRFGIVALSRMTWPGPAGVAALCMLIAVGLLQAPWDRPVSPQIWRGAFAGVFITIMYFALRSAVSQAPWRLPIKALDGWIFAVGTALIPFTHLSDPDISPSPLRTGASVILFAGLVTVNSLIISLRGPGEQSVERAFLARAIPWIALVGAAGAWSETTISLATEKPLFYGLAIGYVALAALQWSAARCSRAVTILLADTAVLAAGIAALILPAGR